MRTALRVRVHSHMRSIRRGLLRELFCWCNHENGYYIPLLNFSVHAKIDQIASVNAPTQYSTTHYLGNSLSNSSHLQGSHSDWKTWKNGKAFPVREKSGNFEQTGKVRENHTKYWKNIRELQKNVMLFFSDI